MMGKLGVSLVGDRDNRWATMEQSTSGANAVQAGGGLGAIASDSTASAMRMMGKLGESLVGDRDNRWALANWVRSAPQLYKSESERKLEAEADRPFAVSSFFEQTALWAELAEPRSPEQVAGSQGNSQHDLLDVTADLTGTDMIEMSSHGPRISYSAATAEWMAAVAHDPDNSSLVIEHLSTLLKSEGHPLGRVLSRFVSLIVSMLDAGGDEVCGSEATCIHFGCSRLHALVLDVLPPLQQHPARLMALDALQAIVSCKVAVSGER